MIVMKLNEINKAKKHKILVWLNFKMNKYFMNLIILMYK